MAPAKFNRPVWLSDFAAVSVQDWFVFPSPHKQALQLLTVSSVSSSPPITEADAKKQDQESQKYNSDAFKLG